MPITIVPNQPTFGQQFGEALSTGLGKGAANLAVQGAGAGLGALSTGLGRLTGLAPKRGLTKEMLSKAGFKDADIDILLSMPDGDQIKMMELILSRAPEETQPVEVPTNVPQTPEENREESQSISPAFIQDYKDITGRDFRSTLPGAQAVEKPKASALFRPTVQQKRQLEATDRAKRDLEIKEEKLRFQKEQAERKEQRELSKEERKEQHYIDAETKPFFEKVKTEGKEADKTLTRLDRMEELIKKGNIRHPIWNSIFDTVAHGVFGTGIDLHFLQNADTQELRKLSREFIKGAKNIFGSRVTEGEIKLLLESVPSLSQTDEGKLRIINNLRLMSEAAQVEKNAMEQIIEENNGQRPRNIESLVSKRAKPQLDKIAEQFKSGIRS